MSPRVTPSLWSFTYFPSSLWQSLWGRSIMNFCSHDIQMMFPWWGQWGILTDLSSAWWKKAQSMGTSQSHRTSGTSFRQWQRVRWKMCHSQCDTHKASSTWADTGEVGRTWKCGWHQRLNIVHVGVKTQGGYVTRYPQEAYSIIAMSLQLEWKYIQCSVPGVRSFLGLVKEALVCRLLMVPLLKEMVPQHLRIILDLITKSSVL